MGRGINFSILEEEIIIENFHKSISEIEKILREEGYNRSRKSIERKIEKLRESGELGLKRKSDKAKAQKASNSKNSETSKEDTFDTGIGWDDLEGW